MLVGSQSDVVLVCMYVCVYVCTYVCIKANYGMFVRMYIYLYEARSQDFQKGGYLSVLCLCMHAYKHARLWGCGGMLT